MVPINFGVRILNGNRWIRGEAWYTFPCKRPPWTNFFIIGRVFKCKEFPTKACLLPNRVKQDQKSTRCDYYMCCAVFLLSLIEDVQNVPNFSMCSMCEFNLQVDWLIECAVSQKKCSYSLASPKWTFFWGHLLGIQRVDIKYVLHHV